MIGNFQKTFKPTEEDKQEKALMYLRLLMNSIQNHDCITCVHRETFVDYEPGKETTYSRCTLDGSYWHKNSCKDYNVDPIIVYGDPMQFTKMEYLTILEALGDLSKNKERNSKDQIAAQALHDKILDNIGYEVPFYEEKAEMTDKTEILFPCWEPITGIITPGGDPAYRCPICKEGFHLYGVENTHNYMNKCPNCGQKLIYSWEKE